MSLESGPHQGGYSAEGGRRRPDGVLLTGVLQFETACEALSFTELDPPLLDKLQMDLVEAVASDDMSNQCPGPVFADVERYQTSRATIVGALATYRRVLPEESYEYFAVDELLDVLDYRPT